MVIFVMIQLISFCQTYEYFDNAILLLGNETHCVVISCYISHVYLGCIVLEVMSNQNGIVLVEYIYVWQILSDWNVIQAEWSQCQVEGYLFIWSQKTHPRIIFCFAHILMRPTWMEKMCILIIYNMPKVIISSSMKIFSYTISIIICIWKKLLD